MTHSLGTAALVAAALVACGPPEARPERAAPGPEADTGPVAMIPAPGDAASNWPRWRGPSGQGLVAGDGYVSRWSADENVIWKVRVPGSGNSSPIVWGETLFLTSADDAGVRSVLAFDRKDGRLLWRREAPAASAERAHPKNGLASSTPTTDGERVYAYLGNQGLLALDFAGEVAWHVPLGPIDAYHGTASSPLLYRDRVIVVQDHGGASGSFVAAWDGATGRALWRTPRDARVGWNSPVAVRAGDRDEIVVSGQRKVVAYDPDSGEELWHARGNTVEVIPTPVVGHGLVFCSSGRAGPTLAIRPGGSGDVTESHVVWSAVKGSPFVPAPVVYGDHLYMVNDMASVVTVYAAATGELEWQERLGRSGRESFSAAPVAVGGRVYFTNDRGETFVVRAGPDFEVLHVNRLGEPVIASPALADGVWYFRTREHLLAVGGGP